MFASPEVRALNEDLRATELDHEAYKAMKAERRLSPAEHDVYAIGAMAAGIFRWSKGSKPIELVTTTDLPPAGASADAVRAWAKSLHKDSSKIVAALDGLDGAALRDELDLGSIGKPPRPLPYPKLVALRFALVEPTPALRALALMPFVSLLMLAWPL